MNFFWQFFPYFSVIVVGESMMPTLKPMQKILIQRSWFFCIFKENDMIVLKDPRSNKFLIKRIKKIKANTYWIEGDNKKASTDSRAFGFVEKQSILGKVIL